MKNYKVKSFMMILWIKLNVNKYIIYKKYIKKKRIRCLQKQLNIRKRQRKKT